MTIKKFIEDLRSEFIQYGLGRKTSWGRLEIEKEFNEALIRVLGKEVEVESNEKSNIQ